MAAGKSSHTDTSHWLAGPGLATDLLPPPSAGHRAQLTWRRRGPRPDTDHGSGHKRGDSRDNNT